MPFFLAEKTHFNYDFLNAVDCLNILTDDEKNELVNNKTDINFSAGETIVKRGVLISNVLFLTKGLVKIEMVNDNKLFTIGIIQPNCFIGIIYCFAFKKFDFTATALEDSEVSFIDNEVFEKFIKTNGGFSLSLIKHISGISNGIFHRMARLSQKNIDGALSILLLEFSVIYNSKTYTLPVVRKELADMLGYSKESVINTLSKFNREGIISVSDRKIEILDISKLEQISKLG
jgi:CRP-like cAMP-binding protein